MYKSLSAVVVKVRPEVVLLLSGGGKIVLKGKAKDARYSIGREVMVCYDYTENRVKNVLFDWDEVSHPTTHIFEEEDTHE